MTTLSIDNIKLGDSAGFSRSFSSNDVELFAKLSGDLNPIHLDDIYAKNTIFGSRIVHGALTTSIFSSIFANTLPGSGSIYLKSSFKFIKPIPLNTTVNYFVKVMEIILAKNKVIFQRDAYIDGTLCITGTAELYISGK